MGHRPRAGPATQGLHPFLRVERSDLDRSHGVFGQLDFETVHFVWDTAIWLITCVLAVRYGRGNPWIWVAFAAASVHEVEHLYLFWIYHADRTFYVNGGFEGISVPFR